MNFCYKMDEKPGRKFPMLVTQAPLLTLLFASTFFGILWIWLGMSAVRNCWLMFMLDGIWLIWAALWSVILGAVIQGTEDITAPRFIYSPYEYLFQSIIIWMFLGSTLLLIVGSGAYLFWIAPQLMRQLFLPCLLAGLFVFAPLFLQGRNIFCLSGMIALLIIFTAHSLLRHYERHLSLTSLPQMENRR